MRIFFARRKRRERELEAEIRAHLEEAVQERLARGQTLEQAEAEARREFGNISLVKDTTREMWRWAWLSALLQDLRYGLRQLRRNPGFTIVAGLTLGLGVGANTAIFSLVDAVLLRPLPYREPGTLVVFHQSYPSVGLERWGISQFLFASMRDQTRSFERSAAYTTNGLNLGGLEEPVRLKGAYVTEGFFDVLGVTPALGRAFLPEEDVPGKNTVCILSNRLWQAEFGGDTHLLGKTLRLNEAAFQVVGVMSPGFLFPSMDTDVWIPLGLNPQRRFGFMYTGIARLKDKMAPRQAEAETTAIQWNLARQSDNPPPEDADMKMIVMPLHQAVTRTARTPLLALLGAVAFVLLIACANIANLLLGRLTARRREFALRIAQGASPRRIVAQLLTESLVLAVFGALLGAALAAGLLALVARLPLAGIPRITEVQFNTGALLVTAGLALATGLLFGIVPALRAYRTDVAGELSEGTRSTASMSNRRLNNWLVAVQVALSIVLLIGAGLLLKSFSHLLAVDPGFQIENLLTMRIALSGRSEPEQMTQFYRSLEDEVSRLPGVAAAGLISNLPIQSDGWSDGYVIEGRENPGPVQPNALIRIAFPGYFHAMGIPLLRGRDFSTADRSETEQVAIVDETLARSYWPDADAIGKRIRFGWDTSDRAWKTIVGVAGNVKHSGLVEASYPHLYMPYGQGENIANPMHLAVRTGADPAMIADSIRARVRELDPNLPVYSIRLMSDIVAESLNSQRVTNLLIGAFAATALLLAAVGIYGVMSLSVSSRRREFGIRIAFGAQRGDVFRAVVGEGFRITAAGVVAGILGALGLTQFLRTLLFEVSPVDFTTFAVVAALLGGAALLACYLPARRAARVDPMVSLRQP